MAIPTVAASNTSSQNSNTLTHTITGASVSGSGSGYIAGILVDRGTTTFSGWPAGWTQIFQGNSGGNSASHVALEVRFLRSTSTLADFDLTSNQTEQSAHFIFRIDDGHLTTDPEASSSTGSDAAPDPPNHTNSYGTDDTLYVVIGGNDHGNDTTSAFPETDNNLSVTSGGTAGVNLGVCTVGVNAGSRNPGTFTIGGSEAWVCATVAVRGAGGAVAPARRIFIT